MIPLRRWLTPMLLLLAAACSDPTEPHDDVDAARRVWLAANVRNYTYEVSIASSWFPASGFYRVQVAGKTSVVSARDADGNPVNDFTLTIDEIWDRLLTARQQGQLNSVLFDDRGVPIDTDYGPWPVDGGVRYRVRNFTPAS